MLCIYHYVDPAAGGSDDFAKGALGISLSYTPELSPDSYSGTSGFVLPSTEIASVVSDTWGGVKAMVRKVFDRYGYPGDASNSGTNDGSVSTGGGDANTGYTSFTGFVPVTINGATYYLDSSIPYIREWLTMYYRRIAG
ncbi:hypothetical protein BaRGS_00011079 [Batillaria attramentaria]|uniref:Peptidase M14 domain-containing protein n=1 Tax=Batillaria attramentaria TaxID=370345 RepID=A0ABD0LDN9_9CAEN